MSILFKKEIEKWEKKREICLNWLKYILCSVFIVPMVIVAILSVVDFEKTSEIVIKYKDYFSFWFFLIWFIIPIVLGVFFIIATIEIIALREKIERFTP